MASFTENGETRFVLGIIPPKTKEKERDDCSLRVFFERFKNDSGGWRYSPINSEIMFADPAQLYVTTGYSNILKSYGSGTMVLAQCSINPNNNTYVTYDQRIDKFKYTDILEILPVGANALKQDRPPLSETEIPVDRLPCTKYVMICQVPDKPDSDGKYQPAVITGPYEFRVKDTVPTDDLNVAARIVIRWPSNGSTAFSDNRLADYGAVSFEKDYDGTIDSLRDDNIMTVSGRAFMVGGISRLDRTSVRTVDIMDDENVIKKYYCIFDHQGTRNTFKDLTPQKMEHFKRPLRNSKMLRDSLSQHRITRLFELVGSMATVEDGITELFSTYISSRDGKQRLTEYLDQHEDEYFGSYRARRQEEEEAKIADFKKKSADAERRYKEQKSRLEDIVQQCMTAQKNLDDTQAQELQGEIDRMNKEIKALEAKKKALDADVAEGLAKAGNISEYSELTQRKPALENEVSALEEKEKALRSTVDSLNTIIENKDGQLMSSYLSMRSFFKAMSQNDGTAVRKWDFSSAPAENQTVPTDAKKRLKLQSHIISELQKALAYHERPLSRESVIGLIISIIQNRFTIFCGLPGCGKTSFLRRLGDAMGLGRRDHLIPVGRGWTSTRDILGYWNSLSGSYQSAPTGFWELLSGIQGEKGAEVTPILVVLDEMNLSSPEHYFSSFLNLADQESSNTIFTGNPEPGHEYLEVPDYLHFVGTVNFDETVNSLSPRLIDRTAVVDFEYVQESDNIGAEPGDMPVYSADTWFRLFSDPGDSIQDADKNSAINSIINIISEDNSKLGRKILVSRRKRRQIASYLNAAGPLLDSASPMLTVDQAVLQFVLPLISGMGPNFCERLEKLLDRLEELGLHSSSSRLQNIITGGRARFDSFSFMS